MTMKFMALALLVLASTAALHAQVAFQTTTAQRPMRQEGVAEASGDVTLVVISPGTMKANSSIDFTFSAPIATTTNLTAANNLSCFIGAGPAACPNTVSLTLVGTNTVHLVNTADINFTAVNTNRLSLRGIRINANAALGVGTVSVAMNATSSDTANNPLTFTTSAGLVGILNSSLDVQFKTNILLQSCAVPNSDSQTAIAGNTAATKYTQGRVGIQEKFGSALLTAANETLLAPATLLNGAVNATQVTITLNGVPAGVRVIIPQTAAHSSSNVGLSTQTIDAIASTNVAGANATALAGVGAPASTTPIFQNGLYNSLQFTPVAGTPVFVDQTVTGTPIVVTYNVFSENPGAVEAAELFFQFGTYNSASTSSTTSIPVIGGNGSPVTATVVLVPANDGTSAPRFAANSVGPTLIQNITDCKTQLLFTWVATVGDVETGVAIANTSSDDAAFGSGTTNGATSQSGTCTLTGYPSVGGLPVSYTTASIPAGQTLAVNMSTITAFSNFAGYVLGVCNFQNAHALAYFTNGRGTVAGPTTAHGYEASIIPIGGRSAEVGLSK